MDSFLLHQVIVVDKVDRVPHACSLAGSVVNGTPKSDPLSCWGVTSFCCSYFLLLGS
jgi:hypothetical protein